MENQTPSEYDSPWKEALDVYFPEFIAFFFPHVDLEINWKRGYETLDKELQKVVQDANLGKRLADKLVKVWLNNGQETIILIHTEIQGQYEADFAQRMYVYHYRIYDKYHQENTEIVSLAILGDEEQNWRPNGYNYHRWGCNLSFNFPIIKLLDYQQNYSLLEQNNNPFSVVIMAYLKSKETRKNLQVRLENKLILVRLLYQRGYTRQRIIQLFRLIDWMMILPQELKTQFETELNHYEEEQRMPYITSIERSGIEKGTLKTARESVIEVLETRFNEVPPSITNTINNINDINRLKQLLKRSILIESLASFESLLSSQRDNTI